MLVDFLHELYENNKDAFVAIDSIQPELDTINQTLLNYFLDTFPKTATEAGIKRWETLLGIIANPDIETLRFRRERIINRLISNIPYTETSLRQVLDNIMGEGNWEYTLDYRNYTLSIYSTIPGQSWWSELELTLTNMIPANLVWQLYLYHASWRTVYENYENWDEIKAAGKTWQDVWEGI